MSCNSVDEFFPTLLIVACFCDDFGFIRNDTCSLNFGNREKDDKTKQELLDSLLSLKQFRPPSPRPLR